MSQEKRFINFRFEQGAAGDPEYLLRGRAVTYGALSSDLGGYKERFAPGAFTKHLATAPEIKCLHNHSADAVLGRTQNGSLKVTDSPQGLDFECQLNPAISFHRDVFESVKSGLTNECSFAFNVDGDDGQDFDDAKDETGKRFTRRTVKRAKIFDCSVVTNPAYPNGTHVSARSLSARAASGTVLTGNMGDAVMRAKAQKKLNDARTLPVILEELRVINAAVLRMEVARAKRFAQEVKEGKEQDRKDQEARWAADKTYQAWLASSEWRHV